MPQTVRDKSDSYNQASQRESLHVKSSARYDDNFEEQDDQEEQEREQENQQEDGGDSPMLKNVRNLGEDDDSSDQD